MLLILILLLTVGNGSQVDHLLLLLGDDLSVLGPVPLEQVLLSDDLALDELIIHAFEAGVVADQLHDFIERRIADVDGVFEEVKDLDKGCGTSWAEHLAWMMSSESWS